MLVQSCNVEKHFRFIFTERKKILYLPFALNDGFKREKYYLLDFDKLNIALHFI